jgi:ribonuclease D
MYSSEIERNGQALLGVIQRALARPESEWPDIPRDRKPDPESTGVLELMQAVLKARAAADNISSSLIATTGDLQSMIDRKPEGSEPDIPVLRGWRRQLVGETLLSILDGRLKVWIEPASGKLRFGHLEHQ